MVDNNTLINDSHTFVSTKYSRKTLINNRVILEINDLTEKRTELSPAETFSFSPDYYFELISNRLVNVTITTSSSSISLDVKNKLFINSEDIVTVVVQNNDLNLNAEIILNFS